RKNEKLQVISGKNLTKEIFSGSTTLPDSNNADWAILGSDRAREQIAPANPKLNRPKFGSLVTETDTVFRWKATALASRYILTVQENGVTVATHDYQNVDAICEGKWCTTAGADLGLLLHDNRSYTWQVTAYNAYGSTGSAWSSFSTEIPGIPALISPDNNAIIAGNITLVWEARPAADSYKVLVKNQNKTYKKKVIALPASCNTEVCTLAIAELLPSDSYNWKVVAKNSLVAGKSASEKHYFTVIDLPTVVPTLSQTPQPTSTAPEATQTPTNTPPATEPPMPTVTPSATTNAPVDLPTAGLHSTVN
ncbi:MAG TPA: hypothetical protein VHL11_23025, partial [Phototrophicaceae bacterium]|nr:hypothetical protein [Phototrophicaceae bacterium]